MALVRWPCRFLVKARYLSAAINALRSRERECLLWWIPERFTYGRDPASQLDVTVREEGRGAEKRAIYGEMAAMAEMDAVPVLLFLLRRPAKVGTSTPQQQQPPVAVVFVIAADADVYMSVCVCLFVCVKDGQPVGRMELN